MAQRFGGKYSPAPNLSDRDGGAPPPRPAPGEAHHRFESRTTWITVMATPFLLSAFFQGSPIGMATNLAGFGLLALGMWLTREGLQAEAAYDARTVARRPAFPRKLFGGILTGLGIAVGASEPGALAGAAVLGFVAAILHWLSFGPDPTTDKGMENIDAFQQDRVARMVAEAETYLKGMAQAITRTGDRHLEARVSMFAATARTVFDRVEQDPTELAAARRYLGVYLMGARDATVKFSDVYAQTRDPRVRADYEALLNDLETNFAALSDRLREGGRSDMEIEISVLRDRLAREGVRMPADTPLLGSQPRTQTLDDLLRYPVEQPVDQKAGR